MERLDFAVTSSRSTNISYWTLEFGQVELEILPPLVGWKHLRVLFRSVGIMECRQWQRPQVDLKGNCILTFDSENDWEEREQSAQEAPKEGQSVFSPTPF